VSDVSYPRHLLTCTSFLLDLVSNSYTITICWKTPVLYRLHALEHCNLLLTDHLTVYQRSANMTFYQALDFHEGEKLMQRRLRVPEMDNPTIPMLSPQASSMLQRAPLLAFGTLDSEGRPWTTVWGGRTGFSRPLGNSTIGIRTPVALELDPVVEALVGQNAEGDVVKEEGEGRLLSGLAIDLETRKRVKLAGRMVAGSLGSTDGDYPTRADIRQGVLQLVARIDESLGMLI
jgi:hypothetical protein